MGIQWPLLLFAVFGGMGMGLLTYVALQVLKNRKGAIQASGSVLALGLLIVGGLCSAFHMGHPERAFYVLTNPTSGISQELVATVIACAATIALVVAFRRAGVSRSLEKGVALVALAVGLLLPLIMGHAYLMEARPAWNTPLLPLMFLGDAWAMGFTAAFGLARFGKASEEELSRTRRYALFGIAAFAVTTALWLVGVAIAYEPAYSRSIERVLSGDLALMFWLGTVVLGMVLPAAVAFASDRMPSGRALAAVAILSVLAGSVAIRVVMYSIGTSVQSFIY